MGKCNGPTDIDKCPTEESFRTRVDELDYSGTRGDGQQETGE